MFSFDRIKQLCMRHFTFSLVLLFSFCQKGLAQCPTSLSYGDSDWPNKITFSDGSTERIFYFKEMLAIAGEGRFWLKSPTFQFVSEGMEGRGNGISLMYFADEAEPEGTLSFRDFKLETETIDCFELPKKFGDNFWFEQRITPRNYRKDDDGRRLMSATIEMPSKRDESFLTAELNHIYIADLPVKQSPEIVVLRTDPDTLRGHIMYNKAYNPDTRDRAGLTVNLEADTLHRFSLPDFAGRPGTFHFFNQLYEVTDINEQHITLDRYEVDREGVKEITENTFFNFNLASTIAEAFPNDQRKYIYRLSGPYSTYHGDQEGQPEDMLTGYTYDAYDPDNTGKGYYEPFQTTTEKQPVSGKEYMRFQPNYKTSLKRRDNDFAYTEALNAAGEKYTLKVTLAPLSRKTKSRGGNTAVDEMLLDKKGNPVSRKYRGSASTPGPVLNYISGSELRIAAETEQQGAQETLWNRGYECPNLLQMNMVLASIAWEDDMVLEFEFEDFIVTQSFVNRSGMDDEGTISYSKKAIAPVQAMVKAEALDVENIHKTQARKLAIYHKDWGIGTPLLHMLSRNIPGFEPYKLAGYFWIDLNHPGIVQIADAEGNVLFVPQ